MATKTKVNKVLIYQDEYRNKIKKNVPSIDGAWVEFYDDVPASFNSEYEEKSKELSDENLVIWGVSRIVADWNFYADESNKVEISIDGINSLPYKVQRWLIKESTDIALTDNEEKKR